MGVHVSLVPIGGHYVTRGTSLLGPVSTWYHRVDQMKSPSKLHMNPIKWAEQEAKPLLPDYVRARDYTEERPTRFLCSRLILSSGDIA